MAAGPSGLQKKNGKSIPPHEFLTDLDEFVGCYRAGQACLINILEFLDFNDEGNNRNLNIPEEYSKGNPLYKQIRPAEGFCIKTLNGEGGLVFINICHCDDIECPSNTILDTLLNMSTDELQTVDLPVSLGKPHRERDEAGDVCLAFDVILNTDFYERQVVRYELLKAYVLVMVMRGLNEKYHLDLQMTIVAQVTEQKYWGTMPQHFIDRKRSAFYEDQELARIFYTARAKRTLCWAKKYAVKRLRKHPGKSFNNFRVRPVHPPRSRTTPCKECVRRNLVNSEEAIEEDSTDEESSEEEDSVEQVEEGSEEGSEEEVSQEGDSDEEDGFEDCSEEDGFEQGSEEEGSGEYEDSGEEEDCEIDEGSEEEEGEEGFEEDEGSEEEEGFEEDDGSEGEEGFEEEEGSEGEEGFEEDEDSEGEEGFEEEESSEEEEGFEEDDGSEGLEGFEEEEESQEEGCDEETGSEDGYYENAEESGRDDVEIDSQEKIDENFEEEINSVEEDSGAEGDVEGSEEEKYSEEDSESESSEECSEEEDNLEDQERMSLEEEIERDLKKEVESILMKGVDKVPIHEDLKEEVEKEIREEVEKYLRDEVQKYFAKEVVKDSYQEVSSTSYEKENDYWGEKCPTEAAMPSYGSIVEPLSPTPGLEASVSMQADLPIKREVEELLDTRLKVEYLDFNNGIYRIGIILEGGNLPTPSVVSPGEMKESILLLNSIVPKEKSYNLEVDVFEVIETEQMQYVAVLCLPGDTRLEGIGVFASVDGVVVCNEKGMRFCEIPLEYPIDPTQIKVIIKRFVLTMIIPFTEEAMKYRREEEEEEDSDSDV